MVEEAAGTSMYESKRDQTNKLIEKKDAKLNEMDAVSESFSTIYWYRHRHQHYTKYVKFVRVTLSQRFYQSFISYHLP